MNFLSLMICILIFFQMAGEGSSIEMVRFFNLSHFQFYSLSLCLFLSVCQILCVCVSLSLIVCRSLSHIHTHTRKYIPTHTHTHLHLITRPLNGAPASIVFPFFFFFCKQRECCERDRQTDRNKHTDRQSDRKTDNQR